MPKIGKKWTEAQKQKQSESMKKAWTDPTVRSRISDAIRLSLSSPEVRARMVAGHAARKALREAEKIAVAPPAQEKVKGKPGRKPKLKPTDAEVLPPEV